MDWPHKNEILFKLDVSDYENNACPDPWVSLEEYGRNYKDAADVLIRSAIARESFVDSVVYPAVFLYRHYIELTLKDIIFRGRCLEREGTGYPKHHNLTDLWSEAKRLISRHYGDETPPELAPVDSCIKELQSHDPDPMAFRYPYDKKGNLHLVERKRGKNKLVHINVCNLQDTMGRVANFLSCIASDMGARLAACSED